MFFDNRAACGYWLEKLSRQSGADGLLGEDVSPVVRMAGIYETELSPIDFGAEMQLAGEAGIDLSVQYAVSDFRGRNPLKHSLLQPVGDFLREFTRQLEAKGFPHIIDSTYTYLEADTSKGDIGTTAIFLNLSGAAARELLPFILVEQQQSERLPAVEKVIQQVDREMVPYYFGFMHSREELPLRLSFYLRDEAGIEGMMAALQRLGIDPGPAAEQMKAIEELRLFTYMVDVDLMADGTLGDTWGVEMTPRDVLPTQQYRMAASPDFARLCSLLKQWNMADDRIDLLPHCLWNCPYQDEYSGGYVMFSHLSHLKLRWKKGDVYPAKVYLQLREIPKQTTINQSIRMSFGE